VLFISAGIGLLSAVGGMVLAMILEMPPGPAMAVVATLLYITAAFFSPKKGLVFRFFQKRKLQRKIHLEDTIKQTFRLQQREGTFDIEKLLANLGFNRSVLQQQLAILRNRGWMDKKRLYLTEAGKEEAIRLVRAHRLWETYLASEVGLNAEQIHEDAEKYEHLLTDEILDEVDKKLGFPTTDPHGSPIPARRGMPAFSLLQMKEAQQGKIAPTQSSEHTTARLWQLGLFPEKTFLIKNKGNAAIEIMQDGKTINVPFDLARRINVEL
jgi:Mn-dependent DtxR family transcriptional regulator